MIVTTKTGKTFVAQRCYISDIDGVLNIGLRDETMVNVVPIFGNPEETETITCFNDEDENENEKVFIGYTYLTMAVYDGNINGVYVVLRKP